MPVILLQFLPYLFQAAADIPQIYDFLNRARTDLQQKNEWTPEAEQAFTQGLQNLKDNPPDWWKEET